MNKKIKVDLTHFDDLKKFAVKVTTFDSDIDIIKGSIVFDAKSILAVLSIDPYGDTYVEIISDNEEEIKRFNSEMEEFISD